MFKLLISSIFIISFFGLIYPSEKENTNLANYCFSLEKIVAKRNIIHHKYKELLNYSTLNLIEVPNNVYSAFHLAIIKLKNYGYQKFYSNLKNLTTVLKSFSSLLR